MSTRATTISRFIDLSINRNFVAKYFGNRRVYPVICLANMTNVFWQDIPRDCITLDLEIVMNSFLKNLDEAKQLMD